MKKIVKEGLPALPADVDITPSWDIIINDYQRDLLVKALTVGVAALKAAGILEDYAKPDIFPDTAEEELTYFIANLKELSVEESLVEMRSGRRTLHGFCL